MLTSPALFVALALSAGPSPVARPNVVFLLADDLGYGDLACSGHPYAKTPSIDSLAADGTRFTQFYVGGATCCPSRTALMTGRRPAAFANYPAAHGFGESGTVTGAMKAAGYATGHFGKWHIGPDPKPGTYGIDSVDVIGGSRRDPRGRDAQIADATVEFIKANKAGPFYLNVWFHTAHNPVDPPRAFVDTFKDVVVDPAAFKNPDVVRDFAEYKAAGEYTNAEMRKRLGDVLQLDTQVARVLKAIDDAGVRGNTIVVFTGDNGPNKYGSAGPCRDGKHSLYDGGVRQTLLVRWPGHVPAGRVDTQSVLAGVDWLPTLCALTGATRKPGPVDGEDVSDVWLGTTRARKTDLMWRTSVPVATPVIRRGDWKLHLPARKRGEVELYDMAKDPGERERRGREPGGREGLSAAVKA